MAWAKAAATNAEVATSVCHGAHILAEAGLLDNRKFTSHRAAIQRPRQKVPTAVVPENVRFVDNGQVVTTAGVSARIDGALHVVERLVGTASASAYSLSGASGPGQLRRGRLTAEKRDDKGRECG